ncbi:MAG: hypothetical protein WCI89_03530 [bacterium]
MRFNKYIIALCIALLPSFAGAASFANSSIFLSKSSAVAGDNIFVHVVIKNDTETKFAGNILFQDGDATIGTLPASLASGEGNVFSVSWVPTAGSHTITATLEDSGGATVEKQSGTFVVAAAPVSTNATQTASVDSSVAIQQTIANISPAVASTTQPLFSALDSVRQGAANIIQDQITATMPKVMPSVLGTSTVYKAQTQPGWSFWSILWTIYLYILTILKSILSTAVFFYPFLALLFFFLLWRLLKRIGGRRR